MKWSFGSTWNQSLEIGRPEKPLRQRENIWASEIGGAYVDRYLKMNAAPPSNPPNPRSNRKFEAGNLLEWVIKLVLMRAGILIHSGEWLSYTYPGLLETTGKLDFYAGGKPNWVRAEQEIAQLGLPDFFSRATEAIIKHFEEKYSEGLDKIILEIKSCSAFMYDKYETRGADLRHKCQLFHYLKAKSIDEGHIVYASKDDLRLLEFEVLNPSETETIYRQDIEAMTHYIKDKVRPPKEPEVLFENFRFSQNFKVAYSGYLTMLYGYENQFAFEERYKKQVASWNRTYQRCVNEQNMTKLNLATIEEIKKVFPNYDELVDLGKTHKAEIPEEKEEE